MFALFGLKNIKFRYKFLLSIMRGGEGFIKIFKYSGKEGNVIKKRYLKICVFMFFIFYASLCLAQIDSTQINALVQSGKLIEPEKVVKDFVQGNATTRVIVNLSKPISLQEKDFKDLNYRVNLQETVKAAQDNVINRLDSSKVRVTNRFVYIFGFSAEVTLEGLKELTEMDEVLSINEDKIIHANLAQGIPLINASTVRNGYDGGGMAIAICDTGINYNHLYLGNGGFPNSKVIGGRDTGQDDNDPMDGNGHGTACAGIAAGNLGTVGDYIGGVAYGAKLYALKMTYTATNGSAWTSDMVEAWEWCVTHQNDNPSYPIMIVSTSFGGEHYTSTCDTAVPAMTTAAANAVAAGITIFVSSGNDGYCDATGWPACITHVNSVGAVYDANIGRQPPGVGYYWCITDTNAWSCIPDKVWVSGCGSYGCFDASTNADLVACYSNTASFLNLLAPSHNAYTLGLGNGYDTDFGGTSAACPYAAGAAAVLQSVAKANQGSYLTPAQVKSTLASTGDSVNDTKHGGTSITKPRVNLGNAANQLKHACCNTGPPGCVDSAIEAAVCAVDSWCCDIYWDSICVSKVESVAGDTCDCCTEHSDATGCYRFDSPDPMAISDCVCAVDPFCCEYYWDLLCASRVESKSCGICYEDCPLPLEPYNPSPANGATNVPLDAILSWNCTLADGFEDGNINEYTILGGTHTVTTASAHDGNYGLESTGSGWMYRNDAAVQAAQGDTISYWVRVRDTNGRAYAGFGATASGTYSIVAAPSSNELLLQLNQGYSFFNIGSSPQTWNNQWYRMEVEWGLNGVIKGRLYDSDGVTLLNTVKAVDNTYNSGGIAFRSFGIAPDYFDTIQICGSSSPAEASINKALKERMAQAPKVPEVPVQSDEDLVWDEENGTYVPADTLKANQKSEVQKTEVPAGYSIKEGMLVEGESKAVVSKPVKQTTPSISASEDPASIVITFDDLNAPCFFAQTVRLTDNYLAYGVTFAGPGGNDGGAIIDECGGFGVSGHSSPNFLAFNTVATLQDGGIPRGPETIYFNPTVSEVKAIVGSQHTGTVTMNAYEGATLVDSATVTLSTTMTPISVSGQNIDKVVVSCTAYAFVLDNLMYAPSCRTKNDVYLGTTSPPTSKVCSNIPTTFCDPGILSGNTKYYWKVDARTPSGSASGPIWNFTTKCTAPPVINDIAFKECISGLCTAPIKVVASDPCGGTLTYTYTPLNGGTIIGSGPDVAFDPPSIAPGYPCPHKVEVTVTSSASGLSTSETIGIFVKIAGDINGDGLVNATDKLLLKNKLGWSGNPGAIPEDVNCDGYVNATDKLILRKTLGANWGCKCQYISSCEGKCCGEFTVCDPTGPCYCMKTTEGYGLCINSYSCSGLEDCKTSADCPSGKVCYECTCCGRNVCAPTTCIPGGPSGVSERAGGLTMTGQ
jgi:subtilisin family serine protease